MKWYKVRYTLPVNEGSKPETEARQAESESEARRRVFEYYTIKCSGVYGVPEIVSVESFESLKALEKSIGGAK